VIGIIGILAAILFPVFARARESGRRAACLNNLRQIGVAFGLYLQDHDEMFPNNGDPYLWMGRRWRWPLKPYLALAFERDPSDPQNPLKSAQKGASILICPSDERARQIWDDTSYGYAACFYHTSSQVAAMTVNDLWQYNNFPCYSQSLALVDYPAQKALVAEWLTNHHPPRVGWWDWRGYRNYLFVDGHARYLPATAILPAVDGFPDINLTVGGVSGVDVR